MYLFVLEYELGDIHVFRNIPDDIEDLEEFVTIELGFHLDQVKYMTAEEDGVIHYLTYKNDTIHYDGADYIGQKF